MAYTLGTILFQNYKNQRKAIALSYFVKGGRTPAQLATLYIVHYFNLVSINLYMHQLGTIQSPLKRGRN